MKLLIDFETRSRADLTKTGQHIYARHESTEVLCIGWKIIGEKKNHIVTMPQIYTDTGTSEFKRAVKEAKYFVAHNAAFEQAIWKYCLLHSTRLGASLPHIPIEKWICTLSYCSILNLPRGLEKAAEALNLKSKKDTEGRKLLLQMCKPSRPIQNIGEWVEWVETDEALKRLYKYCEQDLNTEEELFLKLDTINPFTAKERKLWVLDQKINQRGFKTDIPTTTHILKLIKQEELELTERLKLITFGWVKTPKQVKNIMDFIKDQGFNIPNLQSKTVDDTLELVEKEGHVKNDTVIEVLKIRQALGKSSTSKYESFLHRYDFLDDRVRDTLLYHGASTGRWSGVGIQPHNFPKGTIKISSDTLSNILECDLHTLRLLYKNPMSLFSSVIRNMIIASEDKNIYAADFSSIEARVLLWVAGDVKGLKEYEDGLDTYITMAGTIYQVDWKDIALEYEREGYSERRHLGKKVILACGYQLGLKKFIQICKEEGLKLADSLLQRAHTAFKEKYPKIPQVWGNYERAAIFAVMNKGKRIKVNKVVWYVKDNFLFAQLPSGRRLAYYGPQVKNERTPWGEMRPKLYHWTVDSKTKQWVLRPTYGGMLTENIVQAISRDCMAEAMVRCEEAGYDCLFTVHDENVTENYSTKGSLEEFSKLMSKRPEWGLDIPLKVSAWAGNRYKK